jgi:hypothetical protein
LGYAADSILEEGFLCIAIYLSSDKPLHALAWDLPGRVISLCEIDGETEARTVFSKPHVYSIGSRKTGDGCGFQGDSKDSQMAREALANFLERALELVPDLEMFIAFLDPYNEFPAPERFEKVGPSDFRTWITQFDPNSFIVVIKED